MEKITLERRKEIGAAIALHRQKCGYTVRELAAITGYAPANISKIEKGAYNVSIDILGNICNALGVKIHID